MQNVVISVHIPKTGGTSFRQILQGTFGGEIIEDYDWLERPGVLSGTALSGSDEDIRKALRHVRCIHGHFPAQKYKRLFEVEGIRPIFITWLRDPVERAASAYYFLRSNPSHQPIEKMPPWEHAAKTMDAEEFLTKTKYGENRQFAQLRNMPIEEFAFVGCTEAYDASIEVFTRLFRPDRKIAEIPTERRNPDRKGTRYDLTPRIRKALVDMNVRDAALHRYAQGWVAGAHKVLQTT
ncbi:sulfotransferase family 2 domain-containing protein [Paracoccus albus]|uniref:sulfotransferase family 2 domain-containing protein n=1 Tax=Paracoccus albus TaxID=3017784 RepID=UPI0022F05E64|nr:sulfotransferase family 2 domain-containing protein [Paracoccus albus]WBU59905.1 sulfotransferase family 2 domain-containing protein [Paracoccus albus]